MGIMNPEAEKHLVAGLSQLLSARSAGISGFAITDAYQSVDNFFSAILIQNDIKASRNHNDKLNQFWKKFGGFLSSANIEFQDLHDFYALWLTIKYKPNATVPTPRQVLNFIRMAKRTTDKILELIAGDLGMKSEELEDNLYSIIMGSRTLAYEEECAKIHDMWQLEAEAAAEKGFGSKLVNKMLNPSNTSEIRVFSDDKVTKEIISGNPQLTSMVGGLYNSFLRIVTLIQNERFAKEMDQNEIPNFTLSVRLAFNGSLATETIDEWAELISKARETLADRKNIDLKPDDKNIDV